MPTLLVPGHYRAETIRSGYLYQIYAYLMSQHTEHTALHSTGAVVGVVE
ncbi:MAG TPA: hypothetical protein VK099_06560 [Alcanivoracaceae bacterium]|nr:hypothetical protein [Alcanivoracaceae bacterium]